MCAVPGQKERPRDSPKKDRNLITKLNEQNASEWDTSSIPGPKRESTPHHSLTIDIDLNFKKKKRNRVMLLVLT